jgi:hypothetical protein
MECDTYGTEYHLPIYNDHLPFKGSRCPSRELKYSSQGPGKFPVARIVTVSTLGLQVSGEEQVYSGGFVSETLRVK